MLTPVKLNSFTHLRALLVLLDCGIWVIVRNLIIFTCYNNLY
jgi:hypothetical protein